MLHPGPADEFSAAILPIYPRNPEHRGHRGAAGSWQ